MIKHPADAVSLRRSSSAERIAAFVNALVAAVLILLLLPLLICIALAIYLEDGGPVLFHQCRLAQRGKQFAMYKFRKFSAGCSSSGRAVTLRNDDRFTRIGHLLEWTKLDELPQLFNVLKGDMFIVGPRPESLAFADCFQGRYRELLEYRPGLLGPAQALFRNESAFYPVGQDPEEFYRQVLFPIKADIDLSYYPERSWYVDIAWATRCGLAVLGLAGGHRKAGIAVTAVDWTAPEQSPYKQTVG